MMKDMMMQKMMDGKKADGKMSDQEIQAKMDVVQELLHMAQQAMGSKVKNGMDEMQKVSVMAPDKASLMDGLDLAKGVADDPSVMMDDSDKDETDETPAEEKAEDMPMSAEMGSDDTPDAPEEEESSPFGKPKMKPAKKKLFSMED